jgi:branched-chain amino acid transport system permease protein
MLTYLLQQTLNVIQLGSIYALIALGYSLVYGVLRLFNFAHGDIFMAGAFIGLAGVLSWHFGFVTSLLLGIGGGALIAVLVEQLAYRPLRNAPKVSMLITALACGLILEHIVLIINPYPQYVPILINNISWSFAGLTFSSLQLLIIAIAVVLMWLLDYGSRHTLLGLAQRAVANNSQALTLIGVPLNRIIFLTFAISGGLAGAAGILYAQSYPVIEPYMGVSVGWKAFVSAVIGGIGNIRGAMFGGFLLAAVEIYMVAFFPSSFRDFAAFGLLVLFLMFRPYGLLGKPAAEKI